MVNFALTSFASQLERRLRKSKKSTGAVVEGDVAEVDAGGAAGVGKAP